MADYPSYPQEVGSSERVIDPIIISRSRSGAAKSRFLQSSIKKEFTVVHKWLTTSDKDALLTFLYVTKRGLTFTFCWNHATGTVYTVLLDEQRGLQINSDGDRWNVTVNLAEA